MSSTRHAGRRPALVIFASASLLLPCAAAASGRPARVAPAPEAAAHDVSRQAGFESRQSESEFAPDSRFERLAVPRRPLRVDYEYPPDHTDRLERDRPVRLASHPSPYRATVHR